MANLKDLIVNGTARIIGKTYSSEFVGDLAGNAETATKAEKDLKGLPITAYIKDLSVDGQTITYTKGDDKQNTITTQDTTYLAATQSVDGLMSAGDKATLDNIAGSNTPFVRKKEDTGCSYNNLASFHTHGTTYKYLRITIPQAGSSYTMCTLEISLKQSYNQGYFGKILFHGKWSTSDEWNTLFSYVYGRLSRDVKLYTSDKKYIYITGSDAWATCSVDKMLIGDNATNYDLSAVIIDGVNSLPSTYQEVSMIYGKASQDGEGNIISDTYLKLSGGTMDGTLNVRATNAIAGGYNEGIRIAVGKGDWSTLCLGSSATSDVGTIDGQWFLGCNLRTNGRKLYISHNGGSESNTYFYADAASTMTPSLKVGGKIAGNTVEGAVWNDLSDSIPVDDGCELEHGYCYCFDGEKYTKSSKYLDEGIIGIHSDTYGFKMGAEEGKKKMDVAVAGFVLAYVDKEYKPGTPLTCTENGYLTEIKKEDKIEYPERIVATYWKSEPADEWGSDDRKVKVNGRKWVKIK